MKIQVNVAKEIEKAQSILDDCIEAISVLDNAIECKFLLDKHSLECQKWIKEYKQRIEHIDSALEIARAKIARNNG